MTSEGKDPVITAPPDGYRGVHADVTASRSEQHDHDNAPPSMAKSSKDHMESEASNVTEASRLETASLDQGGERESHTTPEGSVSAALLVDSHDSDADSSVEIPIEPSTASARSSVYESVVENGRTYHKYSKGGKYYCPNDEYEQERLDMQHHLFGMSLNGKLHLAPVKNPRLVLDIGTGTGIWAIDFATLHPAAKVIGTDLSPMQPQFVPPNCQFEVDDIEDEWVYNEKFDFIHGRALFACFKDPTVVFKKAFDALSPGGYFEMQDVWFRALSPDGRVGETFTRWILLLVESAKKLGRNWDGVPQYAQWMREVGFVDVVEKIVQIPIGSWPKGEKNKIIGMLNLANVSEAAEAISMAVLTRNGMSTEEVESMVTEVRDQMKDKQYHAYYPFYVVYGRKPE